MIIDKTRGKHRGYLTTRRDEEHLERLRLELGGKPVPGNGKRKAVTA